MIVLGNPQWVLNDLNERLLEGDPSGKFMSLQVGAHDGTDKLSIVLIFNPYADIPEDMQDSSDFLILMSNINTQDDLRAQVLSMIELNLNDKAFDPFRELIQLNLKTLHIFDIGEEDNWR